MESNDIISTDDDILLETERLYRLFALSDIGKSRKQNISLEIQKAQMS